MAGALGLCIWAAADMARGDQEGNAQRAAQIERFLAMLATVREMLAVWRVPPRV